jgi:hypothetical protein
MAAKSVVDSHKRRLKSRHVNLDTHIQKEVNDGGIICSWQNNPSGFKFACKDTKAFMTALIQSPFFAADTGIGQQFQTGASFREVSRPSGLHIIVFKNRYCKELDTKIAYANIHLDSVSPVAGRDQATGSVIYEPGEVLDHVLRDLLHSPVTIRRGRRGAFAEFRF